MSRRVCRRHRTTELFAHPFRVGRDQCASSPNSTGGGRIGAARSLQQRRAGIERGLPSIDASHDPRGEPRDLSQSTGLSLVEMATISTTAAMSIVTIADRFETIAPSRRPT